MPSTLQQATTNPRLRWRLLDTQASLGQSLLGSLLLSPGSWCTRFCRALQESASPVPCKFWRLCGGVNGDVLQEGLCHTPTQSLCTCSSPQLTYTSTGNAQTQFCVSLCECPESWYTQGLFEPSERLWQEWGLILNANSPLLPSCWGCSLALAYGVSLLKINSKIPSVQSLSRVQLFATP